MSPSAASKRPSPRTGLFVTLATLLHRPGTGAPAIGYRGQAAISSPAVPSAWTEAAPVSPAGRGYLSRRLAFASAGLALAVVAFAAPSAQAAFGLHDVDVTYTAADGSAATQAGSHPFAMTTNLDFNTTESQTFPGEEVPDGDLRDLTVETPPGLVVNRDAAPHCTAAEFRPPGGEEPQCARATTVGFTEVALSDPNAIYTSRVYNLVPPPGVTARLGFAVLGLAVTVDLNLSQSPPYNGIARVSNTPQVFSVYGSKLTVWGTPADPAHDAQRGGPVDGIERPFLTLPRSCSGPLPVTLQATSWQGGFFRETIFSHGDAGEPLGLTGCSALAFNSSIAAKPTSEAASSPTGLDFGLDLTDEGLANPTGAAGADVEKAVVTLPAGMSVNPSQAEGLEVCSEADLARETLAAAPAEGCPQASKIGTIEVESPLLEGQLLKGSLFVAKPYENQFGSLLALYIVIRNPELGIFVIQPARIESDPVTGQLTTTTEHMPQLPFSHFRLHFREGARSPLVTPPACGAYDGHDPAHEAVTAVLTPSSGAAPITTTSAFQIVSGPDNGPCPTAGLPPFHPGLVAGTLNNAAGRFSPFDVRLFRSDSEQEFTNFSIKLPPGIVGKLAGVPFCPDAAIAAAKARTGPRGGFEELASPSCPAASQIGTSLAGAGVGPALTYAPGKVYLAGPYHGSPLSLVSITAGVVGPFDIGTVVVREAFKINPETAEVFIDATGSDPIPHIIKGIPVHLRDIRVYTDRPEFVLNPTDCTRTSTASTLLGSGLDFVSAADDNPVTVSTPFQAADCAALPFKPKLSFKLVGGTRRGQNPSLHAHLAMNGIGEAAIKSASVALPRSEFLDNAHIGTVCTRVQFREGAVPGEKCPAASVYGHVSALTPILEGPLEGPIYLRSSEHQLPDLVAALHHQEINVALVGRVDSVKGGGIRNTFEFVPDAPVTSADFTFDGAAKGLLENSTNLCVGKHLATVKLKGHNGKLSNYKAPLQPKGCKKGATKKKRSQSRGRHR